MDKKLFSVIGIMSGTSLDGLDIAMCNFFLDNKGIWTYAIIIADCINYSVEWRTKLNDAPRLSGLELMYRHKEYGAFIGNEVNSFIRYNGLKPDFIASHGHTVFHEPAKMLSFQLGDGAAIYAAANLPVVCDFRSVDVCLGGQGAPLVPLGDALLFKDYDYCLNLGGIANISYQVGEKKIAYDICGCNLLLNKLAKEKVFEDFEYDNNGNCARTGVVDIGLLNKLNEWGYISAMPPKSLDKETMFMELMPIINSFEIRIEDKLATVTEHIATQIAAVAKKYKGKMLITGGGAFNGFLVEKIKEKCAVSIVIPDSTLINYKEALIFAFLGVLRVRNEVNSLSSVTGAAFDNIGGAVYGDIKTGVTKPKSELKKISGFILVMFLFTVFVFLMLALSWRLTYGENYP